MAGHKVKCPGCELYFDRDNVPHVHYKNRYWHKNCYDSTIQKAVQEEKDLKELEEYILKILKLEYINARVKKQIKDMQSEYGFSYTGMLKSLMYFYEVKGNSTEKANSGIGIVPYVYEDAKKYFFTIYMARKQNENKEVNAYVKTGMTVRIKSPQAVKRFKPINFEIIEKEIINGE